MKAPLTLFFVLITLFTFSQESINDSNTLENQFDKLYRTSSSYQTYKVISKQKYQQLKKNVLDSINASKNIVSDKEQLLKAERDNIIKIKQELNLTKTNLETSTKKENSITLFGSSITKATYNIILWSLIIIFLFSTFFFVYKFSRSNVITKKAQNDLYEVEKEYENHRKKALEREQKLRRQLQDEINKQRNS